MSHAGADATSSSAPGRGRGGGRGRPTRARGRGRGSFRFPGQKPSDSDNVLSSLEHPGAAAATQSHGLDVDAKRKPVRKPGDRRGSTTTTASEHVVETSAPRLEKELPPHIAGAAVDAESLVSRVRELAINGHAHTSSMESRFTMSLNWADEEDDPDSLPDLDDWAVKTKVPASEKAPEQAPIVVHEVSPEVQAPATDSKVESQPIPAAAPPSTAVETSAPRSTQEEIIQSSAAQKTETPTPTKKSRPGLEASMWASASPDSPPPAAPQKERRARQVNSRGSASISRLTDLPFHPLNIARAAESNTPSPSKVDERTNRPETKLSPRKPHARPVISTDALSRLSRTLGRDALRPQQPTTT